MNSLRYKSGLFRVVSPAHGLVWARRCGEMLFCKKICLRIVPPLQMLFVKMILFKMNHTQILSGGHMAIPVVLILSGLLCIVTGLGFHLGYFRRGIVYWTTNSSAVYASLPLGIALLFLGFGSQLSTVDLRRNFLIVALFFVVIGIISAITMPMFLTPWWFRYLRENYDEVFIILMKDASKNYSEWLERTRDLEGLSKWAEEVVRRTTLSE